MSSEIGTLGLEMLRRIKESLDPTGIMNPGKLIPAATAEAPAIGEASIASPLKEKP